MKEKYCSIADWTSEQAGNICSL